MTTYLKEDGMTVVEREVVEAPAVVPVTPSILDPRVERGAALLDEKMPGWSKMIDVDVFELANGQKCVLGQIGLCIYETGAYTETAEALLGDAWGEAPRAHGFLGNCIDHGAGDWQRLEQDWRLAILARRTTSA